MKRTDMTPIFRDYRLSSLVPVFAVVPLALGLLSCRPPSGEEFGGAGSFPAPSVTEVILPSRGLYCGGDALRFDVSFDEPVTVSGSPAINIRIGANVHGVSYESGSGTSTVSFSLVLPSGLTDVDGIEFESSSFDFSSGSIRSISGILAGGELPISNLDLESVHVQSLPISCNGLRVWYDLADSSTVFSDSDCMFAASSGDSVGCLASKGYFVNNAVQSGVDKPIWQTGIVNGLPSMSVDGSGKSLVVDNFSGSNGLENDPAMSVVVVYNSNGTPGPMSLHHQASAWAGGFWGAHRWDYNVPTKSSITANNLTHSPGTMNISVYTKAPGDLSDQTAAIFKNGVQGMNYVISGTQQTISYDPSTVLRVGGWGNSVGVNSMNGTISEIILFNRVLSDEERRSIEGYLAHKWWGAGTMNLLEDDHPFKSISPHG